MRCRARGSSMTMRCQAHGLCMRRGRCGEFAEFFDRVVTGQAAFGLAGCWQRQAVILLDGRLARLDDWQAGEGARP
ncbi:conserved hypothetical protein [Ricinus communis]|uniref:Uncharacterized protein n=1 Tax=Ricinus communis TaxID=3988 RepID=B9TQU7_RICCO|nr:conserved hypothetical protein [Ricinus communis]